MRPNQYSSEKRRKELERKKKQEEKAARKLERRHHDEGIAGTDIAVTGAAETKDAPPQPDLRPTPQHPDGEERGT